MTALDKALLMLSPHSAALFTGELPVEIGLLTALQVLTITQNQLTGEIPESVGNLLALTILHLNDNQLSGTSTSEVVYDFLGVSRQHSRCLPTFLPTIAALCDHGSDV